MNDSTANTTTNEPPRLDDAALDRLTAGITLALIRVDGAWMTACDLLAERNRLRADLAKAIAERDEARRQYCVSEAHRENRRLWPPREATPEEIVDLSIKIAAERGWDCFKEEER